MGRKKKEQTVLKVAEETGVEASDLERLPVEALDKLDALVPDEEEVKESPAPESPKSPVVVEGKTYVGKHPITGEAVYI